MRCLCDMTPAQAAGAAGDLGVLLGLPIERTRYPRRDARAARLAEIEEELFRLLRRAWAKGGEDAIGQAVRALRVGAGKLTPAEVDELLAAMSAMLGPEGFGAAVATSVRGAVVEAYDLGRRSFVAKPAFSLVDMRARDWLARNNNYWIGEHYGSHVGPVIAETVKTEIVEAGLGRRAAGERLREIMEPQFGKRAEGYWRGVAASARTRARNFGAVESFVEGGFAELEVVAMMDERTSEICRAMNGKVFRVEWAAQQRDRMLAAKTPEEARDVAPWPQVDKETAGQIAKEDPRDIARARGILLPPYHFNCRTIVVVR